MDRSLFDYYSRLRDKLTGLYDSDEAGSLARLFVTEISGKSWANILSERTSEMDEATRNSLLEKEFRLLKAEPIQHILGYAWFWDRKFRVNKNVLIPRPETEELCRWICDFHTEEKLNVLDVCTGSGCIAVTLAAQRTSWKVSATDISADALEIAALNAKDHNANVFFTQEDILARDLHLVESSLDILVSNPPYVTESEKEGMHPNVLQYEPDVALFVSDLDPLLFYRKIAGIGMQLLKKGGVLYLEINSRYQKEVSEMLHVSGYTNVTCKMDLQNKPRMIQAWK
jgi:release factor glutamine methyltransferase